MKILSTTIIRLRTGLKNDSYNYFDVPWWSLLHDFDLSQFVRKTYCIFKSWFTAVECICSCCIFACMAAVMYMYGNLWNPSLYREWYVIIFKGRKLRKDLDSVQCQFLQYMRRESAWESRSHVIVHYQIGYVILCIW